MQEAPEETLEIEVCPDCTVEKHGMVFKTEYDRRFKNSTRTANFIKTRLCRICDKGNCINKAGQIDSKFVVNLG